MTTVVRVKRRICEEPLDAIVINCKRRKTEVAEASNVESFSAVLKFAGTLNFKEENFAAHISKLTKEEVEDAYKRHKPNIISKQRIKNKLESQRNRFRVINCFRALDETELRELDLEPRSGDFKKGYAVVDIEEKSYIPVESNTGEDKQENDSDTNVGKYVYDLYYTKNSDVDDMVLDNEASIQLLDDNLVFDSYRVNGLSPESSDDSSDDSNDENNYRNDYPDTDDSIGEEDMRKAMNDFSIGEDSLSSDAGEEGFVYSVDSEAAGFEEDVDQSDVRRYGEMYARYKARVKKELNSDSDNTSIDSDEYLDNYDERETD